MPIKVAIAGAGLSGLALANALLNDPKKRYQVRLYERDGSAYSLERGGYQIRIGALGLEGLVKCLDTSSWQQLQEVWMEGKARAPAMVDPQSDIVRLRLDEVKLYPQSQAVPRHGLRSVLLEKPLHHNAVNFNSRIVDFSYEKDQVKIRLEDGSEDTVDLLVAADGNNSVINQLCGIDNKYMLDDWSLFQSRGIISEEQVKKLPKTLREAGSVLHPAGSKYFGYSAITEATDEEGKRTGETFLFYAAFIPKEVGDKILQESENEDQTMDLLIRHVRQDLGFAEKGIPCIMAQSRSNLRTGQMSSSRRPSADWRESKGAVAGRVILIGDSIHPMTPGRGQGANNALKDSADLARLLLDDKVSALDNAGWIKLAKEFDSIMYPRAFGWVKASEQMTDLDITTLSGAVKVWVGWYVLMVLGWGVSALELLRLKRAQSLVPKV